MSNTPPITTDSLSQILGSPVTSLQIQPIGAAEGFMSNLFRLTLKGEALPDSLVLKMSSTDPVTRDLAYRFGAYDREQYFYRQLAGQSVVRTPRCYYNGEDEFMLLLEDVGNWPRIEVTRGADLDTAITAVIQLARLHASHWASPPNAVEDFSTGFTAAAGDMSAFALDRLHELPSSESVRFMQRYAGNSINHLPVFMSQQQVFSHMDYRLDNMRINGNDLVLFDWGDCSLAPPGFDLAYFMITSLDAQDRQGWERQLLETYWQELASNGAVYSEQALFDSYRSALPPGFYLAALVLNSGHHEYGQLLAGRCLSAITDHLTFLIHQFH